jgi:type I restriction enzyme S subunit
MQQSLSATLDSAREALFDAELERGQTKAGWASKTVSDVVISGPSNGKSAPANDEQRGIPTLSISAVRQGRIEAGKAVKFVDISRSEVSAFVLQDDDFLVVRGNGNKQLMGRGVLVTGGLPEGCIFPDLLIRLRFDPEQILPEFAAEQWNSASRHQALLRHAKSTNGIWKINGKDIKQHQLVVPPIEEQLRILADIGDLKKAQAKVDAETSAVRSLRQLVLTEVFDR